MIILPDFTTLHKLYNLILALQLCIKKSYTTCTLYPEKSKSIFILDNRNNRRKELGIDSIKRTFDFHPFFVMKFCLRQVFRINAILLSIQCIAPIFVVKTRIAGLTPFYLKP